MDTATLMHPTPKDYGPWPRTCVYGAHTFFTFSHTARVCHEHQQHNRNFEARERRHAHRCGVPYIPGSR